MAKQPPLTEEQAQALLLPFPSGTRVRFTKALTTMNRVLQSHEGEEGTAQSSFIQTATHKPQVLVQFDRHDSYEGRWWIDPRKLEVVA